MTAKMPSLQCVDSPVAPGSNAANPGMTEKPASATAGDLTIGTLVELNRIGRYGYVQAALTGQQYVFVIGQALSHVQSIGLKVGDSLRFRVGAPGHADLLEVAQTADSFRSMRGGYLLRGESPPAREQLTQVEVKARRQADLADLPRIGTRNIESQAHLVQSVEDMAFSLASFREELYLEGHPNWWHLADMLDDAMDVLDALPKLIGPPVDLSGPGT